MRISLFFCDARASFLLWGSISPVVRRSPVYALTFLVLWVGKRVGHSSGMPRFRYCFLRVDTALWIESCGLLLVCDVRLHVRTCRVVVLYRCKRSTGVALALTLGFFVWRHPGTGAMDFHPSC